MAHMIRIHSPGGPENMVWEDVPVGDPGPGQIRIRQGAVGLNYIDVYHRTGLYPLPLPATLGMEGAGTVEAVGPDVTALQPGDRVAYASGPVGAYAEARLMPADRVVKLPDTISFDQGAAMMLQGMTVEYLIRRCFRVEPGQTVLFHAAAGGVGLIAVQWLKQLGAHVIGTVGSEEKAALARAHGCDHVILYDREDVAKRVREITGGKGVPVVYDSVGRATLNASLDSLSPRGLLVSFGNASGPINDFNLAVLSQKGSLYITRPSMMTYLADRQEMADSAKLLFEAVAKGLKVEVMQRYALKDAAEAHRALEARRTTGSTVLIP